MGLWFTEEFNPDAGAGLTFEIEEIVYDGRSEYQRIVIYATRGLGRVMVIDGYTMLAEKDEFTYHEMLAHVPAFAHAAPRRACVIGGGDGGLVREVLKHPSVEAVDWVEIDRQVVEVSNRYLRPFCGAPDDSRLTLHCTDGAAFVETATRPYDLILVDSTDPIGPAEVLFGEPFYRSCRERLTERGLFAAQIGSPFWQAPVVQGAVRAGRAVFAQARVYTSTVPTYPGSQWCFLCGCKSGDPSPDRPHERAALEGLRYYNAAIHTAAFALPEFVQELVRSA
jgi:spermidine synthase